jgi:hypothetical protein
MIGNNQDRARDGNRSPFGTTAPGKATILRAQVVVCSTLRMSGLNQGRFEVLVAFGRLAGIIPPSAFLFAWCKASPGCSMPSGFKTAHVNAGCIYRYHRGSPAFCVL